MKKYSIAFFINASIGFVVLFTILVYIYMLWLSSDRIFIIDDELTSKQHLDKYGACLVTKGISVQTADKLKSKCDENKYAEIKEHMLNDHNLKRIIGEATGSQDYIFQDYIWIIQKSSVHTCHRDNNGDFFNEGQKNPSYTMLVYLEDMEKCLSVIPKSHSDINSHFIDFNNSLRTIICNKGDVVIFNANLIHVGCINEKDDNIRIQLKVTHKLDIPHIAYYQNYNKVLNEDNKVPKFIRKTQRSISCIFPGISNYTQQENISSARGSDNGAEIGYGQKVFSYLFYGNENYYDLKNF